MMVVIGSSGLGALCFSLFPLRAVHDSCRGAIIIMCVLVLWCSTVASGLCELDPLRRQHCQVERELDES
jgi:hypothetical protein